MSRVRRVEDRRELERTVDEFITRGYKVESDGKSSTRLKERDWGDGGVHLLLALLTGWWTFGLSNALYAIHSYVTSEEVIIKIDPEAGDER
jgi:hypothetical protein